MALDGHLPALARTGIDGLDDILNGGLTPDRMYLIEGTPGTGKTTLGLGFLLAGASVGEAGLYITLAETEVSNFARWRRLTAGRWTRCRCSKWYPPTALAKITNRRCCIPARSSWARRSAT
ncbi:ATPase domain-containing protein [Sphingomonas faeni]|uniref:ATPase domain-containing protein n=1 Tax=Sphingomonas faeni TaxID=185950 RepID=UPI0027D7D7B3|nr:ATPase domain-containing protein [Sphingomonas faeni]